MMKLISHTIWEYELMIFSALISLILKGKYFFSQVAYDEVDFSFKLGI